MIQRTLAMIKPDAVKGKWIGGIINSIQGASLNILKLEMITMTEGEAASFYHEHEGKPFFDGLIKHTASGPVVAMVLEGEKAIHRWRLLMGATDPRDAKPGTLRRVYGEDTPANAVHGSDSEESARREIDFFFGRV